MKLQNCHNLKDLPPAIRAVAVIHAWTGLTSPRGIKKIADMAGIQCRSPAWISSIAQSVHMPSNEDAFTRLRECYMNEHGLGSTSSMTSLAVDLVEYIAMCNGGPIQHSNTYTEIELPYTDDTESVQEDKLMTLRGYMINNPLDDNNPDLKEIPVAGTSPDIPADLLSQLQNALDILPRQEAQITAAAAEIDLKNQMIEQNQDTIKELNVRIEDMQQQILNGGAAKDWQQAIDVLDQDEVIAQLCGSTCVGLDETVQNFIKDNQQVVNPHYEWPDDLNPTDMTQYVPREVAQGNPILFTGPTGTGKTEGAQNLFAHKHGAWAKVSFHMGTKYGALFAQMQAADGRTYTMLGVIILSMLSGIPLILDEVDHCDEFVQSMLHEILERKSVFIPEINKTIHAKEGWTCIATCNSAGDNTGMYHGVMGTAFEDRFSIWKIDYPDWRTEMKIIDKVSGCKNPEHKLIAKMFKDLRAKVGEELKGPFSLRRAIKIAVDMKVAEEHGVDRAKAMEQAAMANLIYRNTLEEQMTIAEVYQAHMGQELPVSVAK